MDISIVAEYSLWWVLIYALISLFLVFWQYYHKKPYHNDLSKGKIFFLSSIRWLSFMFLFLLLLEPRFKSSFSKITKPILVFAQDNSGSLRYCKDSSYYINEYPKQIEQFLENASDRFEIKKIAFGEKISALNNFDYHENTTDFSNLFDFLKENYNNTNNVQIVLASDGLYNKGSNPRYETQGISFPIHTIQLGDTTKIEDVSIHSVRTNDLGFLNANLPVRVGIKAANLSGENVSIKIYNELKLLASENLSITNNAFFVERDFFIKPTNVGLQKFKIEVFSKNQEYTIKNNVYEFVVDILDTQRKIGICFDKYHPDISAIKSSIDKNLNFSSELINLTTQTPNLEKINLLVLYQIPSTLNQYRNLFQQIIQKKIPILMIMGGNSDVKALNSLNLGVLFDSETMLYHESRFISNENFSLFDLKKEEQKTLEELPPLLSPSGEWSFISDYQTLGFQKIKSIETLFPLISFLNINQQKIAWIFGEGLWRWKLQAFQENSDINTFTSVINQTIHYLALKENRNQLVVKCSKEYLEGEEIVVEAELYNKSYELVNQANLELILTNEAGKVFNYDFERNSRSYRLNLSNLEKGNYSYLVKSSDFDQNLEMKGHFLVVSNNLESQNLMADENLLIQISEQTGGINVGVDQFPELMKHIMENENSKSILSTEIKYKDFNEILSFLIFIIILIILEWFLKKYWLGI